ncbi:putative FBD-associated F-box protein At5g56430 isoform X2 [Vicia villosa]|uniref:putative FBD-associated F-box protein At5g56430 isoform X2 n=1 Tax=Vicia villosa TaxID=3911 RepID=UPI00273CC52E|nr:putative FBD-associated F-box protein At5g56430 isoform X2 [Vicia villosa]
MACSKQITPKSTPRRNAPAKVIKPRRKQLAPDLISDLSDCILIHILSFLDAKEAVQTCILSKRWINLWKTLPTLNSSILLNWLNCFANIEALTVDIATLEVFLNFYNLFEVKPPSLVNLKSLKIETYHLLCVPPFDKVVNFLLQNSPSANVETIIVDKWSKM